MMLTTRELRTKRTVDTVQHTSEHQRSQENQRGGRLCIATRMGASGVVSGWSFGAPILLMTKIWREWYGMLSSSRHVPADSPQQATVWVW